MARLVRSAAVAALAAQVVPAATWLPPVRRHLVPALCGNGSDDSVALTFDDGPHPQGTPAVLDALDALGWRATFFVLGTQARRYPEIVKETAARGHEVAVHGDEHRYLLARTPRAARDDLRRAVEAVGAITDEAPRWWRPPYGVLTGPALLAARTLGVRPVLWSAWGRDWRAAATPESVAADVYAGQVAGGTVLLHDSDITSHPDSWRTTAAALPVLADRFVAAGLVVRTLGEHVA